MLSFNKLKYRHKIAFIIFVFTLLPMLVLGSFLSGKIWTGKVKDILAGKNVQLESSVSGIDGLLSSNINKILYISNNYYIINYLETNANQNLLGIMNFSDYLQSVMGAVNSDNFQGDVAIYSLKDTNYDGEYLRSISNLEHEAGAGGASLKEEILESDDGQIVWKFRKAKMNVNSDVESDYIFAYKKVISLNKPLAIIEMRIPFKQLLGFFEYEIPKGSYIAFEETNGPYRHNVVESDIGASRKSADYALSQALQPQIGMITWHLPRSLVFRELKWYWVFVVSLFVVIVAILIFTVEVVSHFLTKRLEQLLRKMNKNVENLINDEMTMQRYTTQDEFGRMGNFFYELLMKVKEYYQRITDYELERKMLETQLLQERFNPHFLYNTLSTIRWISKDEQVKDVVNSMVKYYRIALNKGSSIITIARELEMIGEYMRLQKFAYGNEFEYVIERDEAIGGQLILKHLLQPIVENAVLHGLNGRETGGFIRIAAKQSGDRVVFEISDNGVGIESDKLERMREGTSEGKYGGYGMKNIRKRLDIFYTSGHRFDIRSDRGRGTTVVIEVPALADTDAPHGGGAT